SAWRGPTLSARSAARSPKTAVTRSTCAASDVMASSAGANALRAAPRAPAAHGCWLSIASRSIAAANARKSPVDRDGLFALYMVSGAAGGPAERSGRQAAQMLGADEHRSERIRRSG